MKSAKEDLQKGDFNPFCLVHEDLNEFSQALDGFAREIQRVASKADPCPQIVKEFEEYVRKLKTSVEEKGRLEFKKFYDQSRQEADGRNTASTSRFNRSSTDLTSRFGRTSVASATASYGRSSTDVSQRLAHLSQRTASSYYQRPTPRVPTYDRPVIRRAPRQPVEFDLPRIIAEDAESGYLILYKPCGWVCQTAKLIDYNRCTPMDKLLQMSRPGYPFPKNRTPRIDMQEFLVHDRQLLARLKQNFQFSSFKIKFF